MEIEATAELRQWWYNPKSGMLFGNIFNDKKKRWEDGTAMHTSHVQKFIIEAGASTVYAETLSGNVYKLPMFFRRVSYPGDDPKFFQIAV